MDPEDIDSIAVLGAGTMGHGIAEVAALAGYTVRLRDISEELVTDGYEQIEWSLGKLAEKDQITEDEAATALERIEPVVEVEAAVEDSDLIIEAVPERFDIKQSVFEEVDAHAPKSAIYATNTSSISITDLAETTERPAQFCGMHFFNPPVRRPLVEVIAGEYTDEAVLETIETLAEEFDKTPVRVNKDSPGFIVNRILIPLMNEAAWLVHDGVYDIETIDSTTKFDIGLPMGTFELTDYVGIDVAVDILHYIHDKLGDAYEPCPLLESKVEEGAFGKKTDRGFYDYDNGGVDIPADAGESAVKERLLAIMANEVAKLLEDDVATLDAIEQAMMLGTGFPEGPGKLADEYGIDQLMDNLMERYEATEHPRYRPADSLSKFVERGGFREEQSGSTAEDDYETIQVLGPDDEYVVEIVLDRPHRLNTLSKEVLHELDTALDSIESQNNARAILLRGAGDRAFSAGADVQSLASAGGDPLAGVEVARLGQRVLGRFASIDLPVVAEIDGYCLGGGMELATCADFRLASDRSTFGQPEHDLGLLPGWGGTQRLQHEIGLARAKEIIFTADHYDAETMAEYGFLNDVVEADSIEDRARKFAADLAAGPPIAQKFTKRAMHLGREDAEAGLEIEAQAFGQLMNTDDLMTGITAFMSDEEPEFEGS